MKKIILFLFLLLNFSAHAGLWTEDFTADIDVKITNKTGLLESDLEAGYYWKCNRSYRFPHGGSFGTKVCGEEDGIIPMKNGIISYRGIEGEAGNVPGFLQIFVRKKSDKKILGKYGFATSAGHLEIKGDYVLVRVPEEKITVKLTSGKNPKETNPKNGYLLNVSLSYYFSDVIGIWYGVYEDLLKRHMYLSPNGDLALLEQFVLLKKDVYEKVEVSKGYIDISAGNHHERREFSNIDYTKLPTNLKNFEFNDIKK